MIHTVGIAALLSGGVAQVLKIVFDAIQHRRVNLLKFFDNGGMPSSHTAMVTTLCVGVGRYAGVDSSVFSLTLIFSMYVVFEAAGLRQEVGKQAAMLNDITDELRQTHQLNVARLKELVGHTWGEVLGGFIVGLLIAFLLFRDA